MDKFALTNIAVDFEDGKIKLPKLKKVKAKLHREFNGQIKSATVSQAPSGKYYVSILVETEHEEKKGSSNYLKKKKEIALCHEKITNSRKDDLHKVSHEIISENQVIVSENLQIKDMVKNHPLAKAISDVSWYELTGQLEYKAAWNKRRYIKIDTFYASSQICSSCGYQNAGTKDLSVREWMCPVCGTKHDRDINAAKNILEEELR